MSGPRGYDVRIEFAQPLTLAAVQVRIGPGGAGQAWKPALDKVWAFLRETKVENTGRNVFLYRAAEAPGGGMTADFGVEVTGEFRPQGDVRCVATPSGEVGQVVHVGPYGGLGNAHAALDRWMREEGRRAGASWEIYGHWNSDPEKLETTIRALLL